MNKKLFLSGTLLALLCNSFANADEQTRQELVPIQQYKTTLGDTTYDINQSHSTTGNMVVFQTNSKTILVIKNTNQETVSFIQNEEPYTYDCQQNESSVFYIVNQKKYQASVMVSCGDNIKIEEVN